MAAIVVLSVVWHRSQQVEQKSIGVSSLIVIVVIVLLIG